jgi:hypothetical protein
MKTPKNSRGLWLLANASLLSLPVLIYLWHRRTSVGPVPEVSAPDSFSLPLGGLTLLVLLALPALNIALRFLLRPYRGASELFPAHIGRPKLVLMDVATAVLFAVCLTTAARIGLEGDFEILPILLIWAYLLIAVRAAVYERVRR